MLIGVLIVPWLDGFAKLLGQTLPFLEVAWARFTVQLIVILPLAWFRLGRNMLSLGQWRLQVLIGALLVLASTLFFASSIKPDQGRHSSAQTLAPMGEPSARLSIGTLRTRRRISHTLTHHPCQNQARKIRIFHW